MDLIKMDLVDNNDMNLSIKKIRYYCNKKNINNKYNLIYKKDYDNKEK